eukprot:5015434-Prorocentrum_lima.AAC.1
MPARRELAYRRLVGWVAKAARLRPDMRGMRCLPLKSHGSQRKPQDAGLQARGQRNPQDAGL